MEMVCKIFGHEVIRAYNRDMTPVCFIDHDPRNRKMVQDMNDVRLECAHTLSYVSARCHRQDCAKIFIYQHRKRTYAEYVNAMYFSKLGAKSGGGSDDK